MLTRQGHVLGRLLVGWPRAAWTTTNMVLLAIRVIWNLKVSPAHTGPLQAARRRCSKMAGAAERLDRDPKAVLKLVGRAS
jgi:hypothetical protein